jgi:hypothetical protein
MDTFRIRALQPKQDAWIPKNFPNLVAICFFECRGRMHLEDLPTFSRTLRDLSLSRSSCSMVDLSVLALCTNLEKLDLGQTGLSDLSPLSACISLLEVNLRVSCRDDISPLSACTKLVSVRLESNLNLHDISPLSTLTNLRHLDLSVCLKIDSLAPLSMCTNLQSLSNATNKEVKDISPLSTLTKLRFLELNFNLGVASLAPLSMCTSLQELDLEGNGDLGMQIQVLAPCKQLNWLVLHRCNVPDNMHPFVQHRREAKRILAHEDSYMPGHYEIRRFDHPFWYSPS